MGEPYTDTESLANRSSYLFSCGVGGGGKYREARAFWRIAFSSAAVNSNGPGVGAVLFATIFLLRSCDVRY